MKTKSLLSKVLAAALAVVMLVGLVPNVALAAESRAADETGVEGLYLDKTATLEDDGTYTIQLEAFSTGKTMTVLKQTPTDIVLVLDVSGSMADDDSYTSGNAWTQVTDKVWDTPNDAYHHCPDGSYSPITWTDSWVLNDKNILVHRYRYTCNNCKATRKWDSPGYFDLIEVSWNLWRYTGVKTTEAKILTLQNAVKSFINGVAAKNVGITEAEQQHRVAIVKFASETKKDTIGNDTYKSGSYTYNYTQTVAGLTTVTSESAVVLNGQVDALVPGGATAADKGMEMAQNILQNANTTGRDTVVILFTDGEPTYGDSFQSSVAVSAISTSKTLKSGGTTVYTVGVFGGANPEDSSGRSNKYLNAVSSNYPNAVATQNGNSDINVTWGDGGNNGFYKTPGQTGNLNDIFEEISSSVGTTTVTLNNNAELRDILGDGFVLTDNTSVTVQTDRFKGRDGDGNRVFADSPVLLSSAKTNIDKVQNTVTVSGFDYSTKYLIDGDTADGNNFTAAKRGEKLIVTITGVEATDPAVTDALTSTNSAASGIYKDSAATVPSAIFPQPVTQLSSRTYVLDYAREVTTDLPNTGTHLDQAGMHKFDTANTSLQLAYGNASASSYAPKTMQWSGYDRYYVFGQWKETPKDVTTGNNTWTRVTVLPANNVYYEDTFVTDSENGTVGIVFSEGWRKVVADGSGSNGEDVNGSVQGWVEDLADDTGDSDGTVTMTSSKLATATFTFTGTGFDVYSRTNLKSGKVYAKISWKDAEGGMHNQGLVVDTESASGEYYSIPTLFYSGEYNTYTVKLTVQNDVEDGANYSYCIDGIRIYNPLNPETMDKTVADAYGEELNATFESVRDMLLDAGSLNSVVDNPETDENETKNPEQTVNGYVFIDKADGTVGGTTNVIGTYKDYGPKNEVYLAPGNAIAFYVGTEVKKLHVGLKAPKGGDATAKVSGGGFTEGITVAHTTDLYYEVKPDANGFVVIENASPAGGALLSVTKVKFFAGGGVAETTADELIAAVDRFDAMAVLPYTSKLTPGITDSDIVIENPGPANGNPAIENSAIELLRKLFSDFRGWFHS